MYPFKEYLSAADKLLEQLFTGHGKSWQAHLGAAINMYQRGRSSNLERLGLADFSRTILLKDLPIPDNDSLVADEVLTYEFLSAALIWLDIISSITRGIPPQLLSYHSHTLGLSSRLRLGDVVGCPNWVALQFGRIAALQDKVTYNLQQSLSETTGNEVTANNIKKEIRRGLEQGNFQDFSHHANESASTLTIASDPSNTITTIFAHTAFVYLHLVYHGFGDLEELEPTISETIKISENIGPRYGLRALICPLFILGSVAKQDDEQFFRGIFSSPPLHDPVLQHRARMLPVLEEIWSKRRTASTFTWKDTCALTSTILLI